jgi:RimJ/RimL family protein N-acetyltransferase
MAELTGPDGHAPKPLPLPVVTERLTLRGYREDDLEATLAYYALPEVARYMRQEAHLHRDWWGKGEWSDTLVYGLLREEWDSGRTATVKRVRG